MVVILHHKTGLGVVDASYVIEGLEIVDFSQSQNTVQVTLPFTDDTLLNSWFGKKTSFSFSFVVLPRSDDYTNGTGSPPGSPPYSVAQQLEWLRDNVFSPLGSHEFVDENGTVWVGRVERYRERRDSKDPVGVGVNISFKVGGVIGNF